MMRKGAWLNRPINITKTPATNKHDVLVALANSLPAALDQIRCMDLGFSSRDIAICELTDIFKEMK